MTAKEEEANLKASKEEGEGNQAKEGVKRGLTWVYLVVSG